MQNPDHQKSKCPKCGAGRFEPCVTNNGREALKVHYGRPHWSGQLGTGRSRQTEYPPTVTPPHCLPPEPEPEEPEEPGLW